jgi:N-acyl amino acid synthase FeeM
MKAAEGALPGFSDRILRFLQRVEHRIATTDCDREAAFRLRYDAYVRNGLMEPRSDRRLFDLRYDNAANAWITMTFVDGELAATTRLNLGMGEDSVLPSMAVYPDVVAPRLRAGLVILETTRFAANIEFSRSNPELAYVALRPSYMAAERFDIDLAVASPRLEHMAFYRRILQFVPWCDPRPYPGLTAKFGCMGMDFQEARARVEARYPFYRSTRIEREALFALCEREMDLGFQSINGATRSRIGAELSTV